MKQSRLKIVLFIPVLLVSFLVACDFLEAKIPNQASKKSSQRQTASQKKKNTEEFSVAEFKKLTGLVTDLKKEYTLQNTKDAESCVYGNINILKIDDGSLTLMVGQRPLAYNIFKGDTQADHSERDCKIQVFNRWKPKSKELLHAVTNKCKDEKPVKVEKVIRFSHTKSKSHLNYTVKVTEDDQEKKTFSCELVL